MNIETVYEVIRVFEASSLSEMNLEIEGVKIAVKKPLGEVLVPTVAKAVPEKKSGENDSQMSVGTKECFEIKSPLVGIFYSAPSPEEKPFVAVGAAVKKGDIVGIVEAMKIMNEITAPRDGIVEEILVNDGEMVDFNKALIRLR